MTQVEYDNRTQQILDSLAMDEISVAEAALLLQELADEREDDLIDD